MARFFKFKLTSPIFGIGSEAIPRKWRSGVRRHLCIEPLEGRPLLSTIVNLNGFVGPTAINNSGDIVGGSDVVDSHAKVVVNLSDVTGSGGYAYGLAINDTGEVAGWKVTNGNTHAMLYDGTKIIDLGTLPGDTTSEATGINASGEVVGYSISETTGTYHAFLYDGSFPLINLDSSLKVSSATAISINDSGQIVGFGNFKDGEAGFLYDSSTKSVSELNGFENIIPLTDIQGTLAVNNTGQVVGDGGSEVFPPFYASNATLYDNGDYTDLGTLAGKAISESYGINDQGQIVGSAYNNLSDQDGRAILYSDGKLVDLNTLLPANSGWTLQTAVSINDQGQIVGSGIYNGLIDQKYVFNMSSSDLSMVSAPISSDAQSINAVYTISGANLATPGTIDFYWATGPNISDEIGSTPAKKVATETGVGMYTATKTIASLGTEPANASYILAVADSPSADPTHNVVSVALPVSLTSLAWNTDQDGTSTNADHRGIDFSYLINDTLPDDLTTQIDFYWAKGTSKSDILSKTDSMVLDSTLGAHGWVNHKSLDPLDVFQEVNDPARWGTPPSGATNVLAMIEVDNASNQPILSSNIVPLSLPTSVDAVLNGAVSHDVKTMVFNGHTGPVITATFAPVDQNGTPMSLSEAEVYLGVDHFNWVQNVIHTPPTWGIVTLVNLNTDGLAQKTESLKFINGVIYYINAAGEIDDSKGIVQYHYVNSDFLDPIVQGPSDQLSSKYIRAFIINGVVYPLLVKSDNFYYYYNETLSQDPYDGGYYNYSFAHAMLFSDMPSIPNEAFPYSGGEHLAFVTKLVGIGYDAKNYVDYSLSVANTEFSWSSNYTYTTNNIGIGGIQTAWYGYVPPGFTPASGGITDNYPTPKAVPLQPVSLAPIADQTTNINKNLTTQATASDIAEGMTLTYSIVSSPTFGVSINAENGMISFSSQTVGKFPITVKAADQDGNSGSTTFNITVLPAPTPPTVTIGPNGTATSGKVFTRTGSFQDADASDTFTATVHYGDGTGIVPLTLNPNNTFTLAHTYAAAGTYTASVVVTGKASGPGTSSFSITVASPAVTPPSTPPVTVPTTPVSPVQPISTTTPVPAFNPLTLGPIALGRYSLVTSLYQTVLQRTPDSSGLSYWMAKLTDGLTLKQITRDFYNSSEYRALHHQHKVSPASSAKTSTTARNAGQRSAIVATLYHVILKRNPDLPGYYYWVAQLNKGSSLKKVAASFVRSKEFYQVKSHTTSAKTATKIAERDAKLNAKIVAT